MKIAIYSGPGVGERSGESAFHALRRVLPEAEIIQVSSEEIIRGLLQVDTALLVMPGGRDLPYCNALNGKGTDQIRNFVRSGGRYLGFCAGAYFGSAQVEFERGSQNEVVGRRELSFFPGKAIGSALTPGAFSYANEDSATVATVSDQGGAEVQVYFDGGCYFEGEDRSVEVISRYLDIPEHPPAAVVCRFGLGRALLSGVHPEFSSGWPGSKRPDIDGILSRNQQQRDLFLLAYLEALGMTPRRPAVANA